MFINTRHYIKWIFITIILLVYNFFKLRDDSQRSLNSSSTSSKVFINNVQHIDENSDTDDLSFKTSLNNSRVSKLSSNVDDDNNNDSSITPTLNKSIPRITPEFLQFTNSTPLNHFNSSQDGQSNRKFRRDLTRVW